MDLELALKTKLDNRTPHISSNKEPHTYFSEAGQCSRKISLRLIHRNDPRPEIPYTRSLNSILATTLGDFIHSNVQSALALVEPDLQVEVTSSLDNISGRVDGLYTNTNPDLLDINSDPIPLNSRIVVEIKSMSDYMFTKCNKANQPELSHQLQAMLGAKSLNCPYVHLIYINKSPRTNTPTLLQWIIPLNNDLVEMEQSRLSNILEDSIQNIVAPPEYEGEIIENPDKKFWPCGFCEFIRECKEIGAPKPTPFNFF